MGSSADCRLLLRRGEDEGGITGNDFSVEFFCSNSKMGPMKDKKLYLVMVGLPARGKSTLSAKLKENFTREGVKTRIFNNGDLRRRLIRENTTYPEFYDPNNKEGVALREKIALLNMDLAKGYLANKGQAAILDATNVSLRRRDKTVSVLSDHPILFIECINDDEEILKASIHRKITLPEFNHIDEDDAIKIFEKRIIYYKAIYSPLRDERNFVKLDSLKNRVLQEETADEIPYYDQIRDCLVTDVVKNLFLVRHTETSYNLGNRIGGDPDLTEKGEVQARRIAQHFLKRHIPFIFTSQKKRTIQTAEPIRELQKDCTIIPLEEFNEIDAGICERMSYEEIREKMPGVYLARKKDKYNYVYPKGESYASMKERVETGIKKALYLAGRSENIMIVGQRAANRMILSHFYYRREEDVPYIFVPQNKFYHIVATQYRKLFQLKGYRLDRRQAGTAD
jgi:broad specificity phosphatase PhoE/predicted kinase